MARHRNVSSAANGFTMVEMLVVVAIVLTLMSIFAPAGWGAYESAVVASCHSNQHQLTTAYLAYTNDNLGGLIYAFPDDKRSDAFVKTGPGKDAIRKGALFSYAPDLDAWRCPSNKNSYDRSYVVAAPLNGESWTHSSQMGTDRFSGIVNPARQIVFVEENDVRGWNVGSWMMYADTKNTDKWIDCVGLFHKGGTADTYTFADGHVELWEWESPNTKWASENGQFYYYDPNNPDWQRLRKSYRVMATRGDCKWMP